MKKIVMIMLNAALMTISAQTNDVIEDVIETSTIEIVTDTINGKVVERKIKTITRRTQEVKTDPKDSDQIDADRIFPPSEVVKTYFIDNDDDPFYDEVNTVQYYEHDGEKYMFERNENGFNMALLKNKDDLINKGYAVKSIDLPYYIVRTKDYEGIGYFDAEGDFIIETYDDSSQTMNIFEFEVH